MSRLIALYPRAWRARYGDELEDLAAARPLGIGGTVDLVRGALDAHRHPELVDQAAGVAGAEPVSPQRYEDLRVARRLGLGTMAGAVPLIVAPILAINGPIVFDGDGAYRDGMAAAPFILVAMALLSGGLLGQLIRLGPGHRVARAGAILAIVCGPLWAFGPWLLPILGLAFAGLVIFALGARRADAWPGVAVLALVVPIAMCAGIIAFGIQTQVDRLQGANLFALALVALAPIWLTVGGTLKTLPGVRDDPAPPTEPAPSGSIA